MTRVRRVPKASFEALPLQVHAVLAGVPLHDVTVTDLDGGGPGRRIADVRALGFGRSRERMGLASRALFKLRVALGKIFGWDAVSAADQKDSYVTRIPPEIARRSAIVPGARDGLFRALYELETESLVEAKNSTVHAFLSLALEPTESGYRLYWAVYVQPVSWFTPVYMALIEPFRRFIVYPSLLGNVSRAWSRRYAMPGGA